MTEYQVGDKVRVTDVRDATVVGVDNAGYVYVGDNEYLNPKCAHKLKWTRTIEVIERAPGDCQCGCGEKTSVVTVNSTTRGLVKGEYRRYVAGHNSPTPRPGMDRFKAKVVIHQGSACHTWVGTITEQGYGRFTAEDGKTVYAHRWAYEQEHGKIEGDLQVDHLCRNRACVNLAHLEAVTPLENTLRSREARGYTPKRPEPSGWQAGDIAVSDRGGVRVRQADGGWITAGAEWTTMNDADVERNYRPVVRGGKRVAS